MEEIFISVFLEPVVSNLVSEVIEQATKLSDRARGAFDYKDDISKLSSYLNKLHVALEDEMPFHKRFEESPYDQNPEYKKLVKAMYQIAEDAEDVIQDCEHDDNFWHGLFLCQCERDLWQRLFLPFLVSARVKAIKSRIEGPDSESIQCIRDRMKAIATKTSPETKNAPSSIPVIFQSRMGELRRSSFRLASIRKNSMPRFQAVEDIPVGLDERIRELKGLLLDKETHTLGIHGMGGSGKSMLMKCAWNSEEVLNSFEKHMSIWVSPTSGCQLSWLRQSIAEQIRVNFNESWGEEDAKSQIFRHLVGRRFLMVVDGVWRNQGDGFLSDLGVPPSYKVSGSKIAVISRDNDDLYRISPDIHLISMERLSEEHSLKLFERYAFGSGGSPILPEVSEAAKEIATRCDGHPLALKAYGAAMAGKRDLPFKWQEVSQNQDTRLFGNHGKAESLVLECLGSSYASLSPPLRLAFLYLAAFPENHQVRTADLIDLWNAERLIRAQTPLKLQERGLDLLDLMIHRCLVEGVEVGSLGRVRRCKMHPMLRHLALHILKREDGDDQRTLFQAGDNLTEFPSKNVGPCRRISLMYNSMTCLPQEFECQGLRTLILRHNKRLTVIPSGFLKGLTWLRTLDLSMTGIESLPKALGDLKRLEYLNLSRTELKTLPLQVNRLHRLKKLNLFQCKQLECLPFEMDKLKNLQYLNLRRCAKLEFLPFHVTQIASLQCLIMDGCISLKWEDEDKHKGLDLKQNPLPRNAVHHSRLGDLKSLTNLRYLSFVCATTRIPDGLMGHFVSMERLEICEVPSESLPEDIKEMKILKDLRLSKLERLVKLPFWLCNLQFLERITLEHLKVKVLPSGIFETLNRLRLLEIEHCYGLTELPSEFGKKDAFPSLEELRLDSLKALKELPALEQGSMSLLKELRVRFCPAITQFPRGVENLKKNTRIDIVESSGLIKSVAPGGSDRPRMTHLLDTMTW